MGALLALLAAGSAQGETYRSLLEEYRELLASLETAQAEGETDLVAQFASRLERMRGQARHLALQKPPAQLNDSDELDAFVDLFETTNDVDLMARGLREKLERAGGGQPQLQLQLANAYARMGKGHLAHARRQYEQVISEGDAGEQAEAWARLGLLHFRGKQYRLAHEAILTALELDAGNHAAAAGATAIEIYRGQMADAFERLNSLLRPLEPEEANRMNRLFAPLLQQALEGFTLLRRHYPDEAREHAAYGSFLLSTGRASDALLPLRRSVRLDASNFVAWNSLGSAARVLQQRDQAIEAYQKSLEANPDQPLTKQILEQLQESASRDSAVPPMLRAQ